MYLNVQIPAPIKIYKFYKFYKFSTLSNVIITWEIPFRIGIFFTSPPYEDANLNIEFFNQSITLLKIKSRSSRHF